MVCGVLRSVGSGGGGRRLDSVRVNGSIGGRSVSGKRLLVLLHLVVLLKVAIFLLIIFVVVGRVLLSSFSEVNDLATGAGGDNIVEVDSALGVAVILVILLGYKE